MFWLHFWEAFMMSIFICSQCFEPCIAGRPMFGTQSHFSSHGLVDIHVCGEMVHHLNSYLLNCHGMLYRHLGSIFLMLTFPMVPWGRHFKFLVKFLNTYHWTWYIQACSPSRNIVITQWDLNFLSNQQIQFWMCPNLCFMTKDLQN